MKVPFFESKENQERIIREVESWLDTPFYESTGSKGMKGVSSDCCSCLAMSLQSVSAIGRVPWPKRYVSRGGGEKMLKIMLEVLDGIERLEPIWRKESGDPVPDFMVGDLLVASSGRAMHHLVLFIGENQIVHSWDEKVRIGSLSDHVPKYLHSIYRAYAESDSPDAAGCEAYRG